MNIPKFKIFENDLVKGLKSENANWLFRKSDGFTAMWGKTTKDDMVMSPVPLIWDAEVSTICKGVGGKVCSFCYKANTPNGKNMSLETFKKLLDKIPFITQIAFGADAQGTANPDLFPMMEYARVKGIVPNLTLAEVSDEVADNIAKYCGAAAISVYDDKNIAYNSVKKLTDRGMTQVNFHYMIAKERLKYLYEVIDDIASDSRLEKLNALVLLSLKKKGRGKTGFTSLTQEEFTDVVNYAMSKNVNVGFDSCGAVKAMKTFEKTRPELLDMCVACESTRESGYSDVNGMFFPCSFTAGEHQDWKEGLDIVNCDSFIKDIWFHPKTEAFRKENIKCLNGKKACQIYEV